MTTNQNPELMTSTAIIIDSDGIHFVDDTEPRKMPESDFNSDYPWNVTNTIRIMDSLVTYMEDYYSVIIVHKKPFSRVRSYADITEELEINYSYKHLHVKSNVVTAEFDDRNTWLEYREFDDYYDGELCSVVEVRDQYSKDLYSFIFCTD